MDGDVVGAKELFFAVIVFAPVPMAVKDGGSFGCLMLGQQKVAWDGGASAVIKLKLFQEIVRPHLPGENLNDWVRWARWELPEQLPEPGADFLSLGFPSRARFRDGEFGDGWGLVEPGLPRGRVGLGHECAREGMKNECEDEGLC